MSDYKCPHATVTEYSSLYAAATLEEPGEYVYWYICSECGDVLDDTDLEEDTEILR